MNGLPDPGDAVTLCVPQRERLRAQVIDAGHDYLDLELPGAPRTPAQQFARAALFVEFVNDEGVCRMSGRLGSRGLTGGRSGSGADVRMRFVPAAAPTVFQRREHFRVDAALRVAAWAAGRDHAPEPCWTIELSAGGMRLRGLRAPVAGTVHDFELELSAHEPSIAGTFKVVRVDGRAEAGVRFEWLAERDRARIAEFTVDAMRAERRR